MSANVGLFEVSSIVLFVIVQSVVMEALGWYFVYRKEEYKDSRERAINLSKKIDELKSTMIYAKDTKKR